MPSAIKELLYTQGGLQTGAVFSGILSGISLVSAPGATFGNDPSSTEVMFVSGAGRLKDVLIHVNQVGTGLKFYDAHIPSSGMGVVAASGHKPIAIIPAVNAINSGTGVAASLLAFDMPFRSGLCASCLSGIPGFTVSWTAQSDLPNPQ